MAASSEENPALIAQVKESEVPVPWCAEFNRMISGMKSVHFLLLSYHELLANAKAIVS